MEHKESTIVEKVIPIAAISMIIFGISGLLVEFGMKSSAIYIINVVSLISVSISLTVFAAPAVIDVFIDFKKLFHH